jgi:hypothetical protein
MQKISKFYGKLAENYEQLQIVEEDEENVK